jgi:hypothetical protein
LSKEGEVLGKELYEKNINELVFDKYNMSLCTNANNNNNNNNNSSFNMAQFLPIENNVSFLFSILSILTNFIVISIIDR